MGMWGRKPDQEVLERIAKALERIAGAIAPAPDGAFRTGYEAPNPEGFEGAVLPTDDVAMAAAEAAIMEAYRRGEPPPRVNGEEPPARWTSDMLPPDVMPDDSK